MSDPTERYAFGANRYLLENCARLGARGFTPLWNAQKLGISITMRGA